MSNYLITAAVLLVPGTGAYAAGPEGLANMVAACCSAIAACCAAALSCCG